MKIAVIGSGIAGLVAAWSLSKYGHQVILFERSSKIGFDGHALACKDATTFHDPIDVPLRLMNTLQWPQLAKLYQEIGVAVEEIDSSQSFCWVNRESYFTLGHQRIFEIRPAAIFDLQKLNLAKSLIRFRNKGLRDLKTDATNDLDFGSYLNGTGVDRNFRYRFLYPVLSSTVCTCSYESLDRFPASIMLDALAKITDWQTGAHSFLFRAKFGAEDVVEKLMRENFEVWAGCDVKQISENEKAVSIRYQKSGDILLDHFQHVVVATQANHAGELLEGEWRQVLEGFKYESVEVIVHRDIGLMPEDEKQWSTFNFVANPEQACCSIWLQKYYGNRNVPANLFQTINPIVAPESSQVVSKVRLQRPVVTHKSYKLWDTIEKLHSSPKHRIWVVGSYASPGIPLLESGVVSSLEVASKIHKRNELSLSATES